MFITYSLAEGESLAFARPADSGHPERLPCWRQTEPARQLPNLKQVPVLMVPGEASFHALYDHGTHDYLIQAGVPCTHWRLEDMGVHGNGQMLMLEKNAMEIAERVESWLCGI